MELKKSLDKYVEELLGLHNCVTISGLGSFIYREAPASANHFSFEIRPTVRTVFFNNAIAADDGILVNQIRESEGMSYNQALDAVNLVAGDIRQGLQSKRNVGFGNLGNFFLNSDGHIFFLPTASLNLSPNSFGLPILKLDELDAKHIPTVLKPIAEKESEPVVTKKAAPVVETFEFEEAEVLHLEEQSEQKRNFGWLFKAAAVFAILTLTGTGIYFGKQFFSAKTNTTQQAAIAQTDTNLETKSAVKSETQTTEPAIAPAEPAVNTTETNKTETAVVPHLPEFALQSIEDKLADLKQTKGHYFVLGGMYMNADLAIAECKRWNASHVNAAWIKPENSSLYKVVLARFTSEKEASEFVGNIAVISGGNVSVRQIKIFN
ncbi:MAG: hypothetical protein IT244_00055 [Bacteroidia bacterium]|nr:hypothetical protein [Bacteroidia bacterium]